MPRLTAAQLAARVDGMGATDIVEVCGLAPWEGAGPWRVYNAKLGIGGTSAPTPEQEWGHLLEDFLAERYAAEVGPFERPTTSHRSPTDSWLFASLDGITPDRTIEIKNVGGFMCKDWDVTSEDGVPHYVRAQVLIGMYCSGRSECHVYAMLAGRPAHIWTVRYDHDLAKMLVEKGRDFCRMVAERREPAIDASDECRAYLRHKYPRDERPMLEPDMQAILRLDDMGSARAAAARAVKENTARMKMIDSQILAIIGDHKGVKCDGFQMTWKVDKSGQRRSRFTPRDEE